MKPIFTVVINNVSCFLFVAFGLTIVKAQELKRPDVTHLKAQLNLDTISKSVYGVITLKFNAVKDADTLVIDAKNMTFENLKVNKETVFYSYNNKQIKIPPQRFKSGKNTVTFSYKSYPKKALYFVGWNNDAPNEIWTQGQGKYTSNWLPSFDNVNEKVVFELSVNFNSNYTVLSNGLLKKQTTAKNTTSWTYSMNRPISSYLVALVIGKYDYKRITSRSGIPIYNYYHKQDSSYLVNTYKHTQRIFDVLEEEIGVLYPWQIYRQVPVHDFMYAGMENTTLTVFADTYLRPSEDFEFHNYVNVNAHELAHQWFGNLVTAQSGTHHWLQEGFATYYALLAERAVFGDAYYYQQLFDYAQELKYQEDRGGRSVLLDPNATSTTFYKKGAWALHVLRSLVGDTAFKKGVQHYLTTHAYGNAVTSDFLSSIKRFTTVNLTDFTESWLKADTLPQAEIQSALLVHKASKDRLDTLAFMNQIDCNTAPTCQQLKMNFDNAIDKAFWINHLPECDCDTIDFEHMARNSDDAKLVLTALNKMQVIDSASVALFKDKLLEAPTPIKERLLLLLYQSDPKSNNELLSSTAHIVGRGHYAFRVLWLALALNTEVISFDKKILYEELVNFTSPTYHAETRQLAFEYILYMNLVNETVKNNLEEARTHYNWRFSSFAKEKLSQLNQP